MKIILQVEFYLHTISAYYTTKVVSLIRPYTSCGVFLILNTTFYGKFVTDLQFIVETDINKHIKNINYYTKYNMYI